MHRQELLKLLASHQTHYLEEAAYVQEVAVAKTAALRMSLKAVEDDGMPFVGETPA